MNEEEKASVAKLLCNLAALCDTPEDLATIIEWIEGQPWSSLKYSGSIGLGCPGGRVFVQGQPLDTVNRPD